jgi:hypothetical protein
MNRLLAVAFVALLLSSGVAVRGQMKARPLAIEDYQKRLSDARAMLKATSDTAEAISYSVGYRSKKSLYRVIRRATGLTPKQFRDRAGRLIKLSSRTVWSRTIDARLRRVHQP